MIRSQTLKPLSIIIMALFLACGCVEREEKIRIHEDGSANVSILFKADGWDELYPGRVPASSEGWRLTKTTATLADGKVKYNLSADKEFGPGVALPNTYAHDGLDDAHLHLVFETSLVTEKRDDGTYYHFQRVYKKRDWAHVALLKEIVPDNRMRNLMKKDPKELPLFEREALLRGMTEVELYKKLAFARGAFLQVTPGLPGQDGWLKLFNEVLDLRASLDYRKLAQLLGREDATSDEALAEAADRFEQSILQNLQAGLRMHCGYDETQEQSFFKRYHELEKGYRISEDIEGESFNIAIEMPGEIIGCNVKHVDGAKAVWEFTGKALKDRDHELLISSRVSN